MPAGAGAGGLGAVAPEVITVTAPRIGGQDGYFSMVDSPVGIGPVSGPQFGAPDEQALVDLYHAMDLDRLMRGSRIRGRREELADVQLPAEPELAADLAAMSPWTGEAQERQAARILEALVVQTTSAIGESPELMSEGIAGAIFGAAGVLPRSGAIAIPMPPGAPDPVKAAIDYLNSGAFERLLSRLPILRQLLGAGMVARVLARLVDELNGMLNGEGAVYVDADGNVTYKLKAWSGAFWGAQADIAFDVLPYGVSLDISPDAVGPWTWAPATPWTRAQARARARAAAAAGAWPQVGIAQGMKLLGRERSRYSDELAHLIAEAAGMVDLPFEIAPTVEVVLGRTRAGVGVEVMVGDLSLAQVSARPIAGVEAMTMAATAARADPREHRRRSDERKSAAKQGYLSLNYLITKTWGKVTELGDLGLAALDAITLDRGQKARSWARVKQAMDEGQAWDFDMEKFAYNVLVNELEDRAIAGMSRSGNRLRAGSIDDQLPGSQTAWASRARRNALAGFPG